MAGFNNARFQQPGFFGTEAGGGRSPSYASGGRVFRYGSSVGRVRPGWTTSNSPNRPAFGSVLSKSFTPPAEHVGMDLSSQVFGRLNALIAAMAGAPGMVAGAFDPATFKTVKSPSVGYVNSAVTDLDVRENGWDAFVADEDSDYTPRRVILDAKGTLISAPEGSRIISRGDPAVIPNAPQPPVQPVKSPTQIELEKAQADWEARLAQHNQALDRFNAMNDRMVAEGLAEAEREYWAEQERQHLEYIAQVNARSPDMSISLAPDANGVRVRVRTRLKDDKLITRPRAKDRKFRPAYVRIANALISATYGTYSEVVDALEALAWNVYVLDGRGRPMQAMVKYDRNMAYVLQMVWEGRAKVDLWGFALDYTVQQWSDAAYAFQSRRMDEMALELGWKAPIGISSYSGKWRNQKEFGNDVSSQWIRSSSEFIRSLDVSRARRVQSLWRLPRTS